MGVSGVVLQVLTPATRRAIRRCNAAMLNSLGQSIVCWEWRRDVRSGCSIGGWSGHRTKTPNLAMRQQTGSCRGVMHFNGVYSECATCFATRMLTSTDLTRGMPAKLGLSTTPDDGLACPLVV